MLARARMTGYDPSWFVLGLLAVSPARCGAGGAAVAPGWANVVLYRPLLASTAALRPPARRAWLCQVVVPLYVVARPGRPQSNRQTTYPCPSGFVCRKRGNGLGRNQYCLITCLSRSCWFGIGGDGGSPVRGCAHYCLSASLVFFEDFCFFVVRCGLGLREQSVHDGFLGA